MDTAVIINTGTELLLGSIVNSNASFIASSLALLGIDMFKIISVGDNLKRVKDAFKEEFKRNRVLIFTGGLGGTVDDITKEAVSDALGLPLEDSPEIAALIKEKYLSHGRQYIPTKESLIIKGSETLENPLGSAPGYCLRHEGRIIILLPGVPHEMKAMFPQVERILKNELNIKNIIRSRLIHTLGIREMEVNNAIKDIFERSSNPTIALLASPGEVMIRLTSKGSVSDTDDAIQRVECEIKTRLGEYIWGFDDDTLEDRVGHALESHSLTIAGAESCTGGLVGKMLTDRPGSSSYFLGCAVTYSNEIKSSIIGVSPKTLEKYGAVSKETLSEMISGVKERFSPSISYGVTGIAGPSGGSSEKPVGRVFLGFTYNGNKHYYSYDFLGTRERIRVQSARFLLFNILKEMEKE